jgi:anti-anti-sigma factor
MNMHIDKQNDSKNAVITLSGDITVEHASELCSALREVANDEMNAVVQVGGVEKVDMTFFQLMCSAHRTFTSKNVHFVLKEGKNNLLKKGAGTGFLRHKGCSRDKFSTCAMVMEN